MSEQQKPKGSFFQTCLVIGCVMVFIGSVCAGGIAYWGYQKVRSAILTDPVKVQEMASSMVPGVKPPNGYVAQGGLNMFGFEMAVFGPGHNGTAKPGEADFFLMRLPKSKDLSMEKIKAEMANANPNSGGSGKEKVLLEETITATVGGKPVQALHREVEEDGEKRSEVITVFQDSQDRVVLALASGPTEKFDQAPVQQFFDSLNVSGLKTLDPKQIEAEAPPAPGEPKPTASATDEPEVAPSASEPQEPTATETPDEEE